MDAIFHGVGMGLAVAGIVVLYTLIFIGIYMDKQD
jgi:hypothetical protein